MINAIVLAAGKGTRMKSEHCKVMHGILGEPMIGHIYDNLKAAGVTNIVMVIGHKGEEIKEYFQDKVEYAVQVPQIGSGHAAMQAETLKGKEGTTLIVYGDCALIQKETYEKFIEFSKDYQLACMTTVVKEPKGYGRIIRDKNNNVEKIVEEKDCNEEERKVKEINAGIYCIDNKLLWEYFPLINNNNAQKEYYLTDLIEIFNQHNHKVGAYIVDDPDETIGVNDRSMLADATRWLKNKINKRWMLEGVTMIDPDNTYISKDAIIGKDTIIYPNVYLEGNVKIGEGCTITSNSYIKNSEIGNNTTIESSKIIDSKVGDDVTVGPYSHLRNHSNVGDSVRIGNFVELKNTTLGYNTKCAHLTYVGDATVGEKVNFGCGVVTVNYDGKNKFHTEIEDGAFIGSNVNLIAPVHIGKRAVLAAGSTVNHDVEDGDMAIGRVRQEVKKGYGEKYLNKQGDKK